MQIMAGGLVVFWRKRHLWKWHYPGLPKKATLSRLLSLADSTGSLGPHNSLAFTVLIMRCLYELLSQAGSQL